MHDFWFFCWIAVLLFTVVNTVLCLGDRWALGKDDNNIGQTIWAFILSPILWAWIIVYVIL